MLYRLAACQHWIKISASECFVWVCNGEFGAVLHFTRHWFPSFSLCSVPEMLVYISDVRGLWQRLLISSYLSDNSNTQLVNSPVGVPSDMDCHVCFWDVLLKTSVGLGEIKPKYFACVLFPCIRKGFVAFRTWCGSSEHILWFHCYSQQFLSIEMSSYGYWMATAAPCREAVRGVNCWMMYVFKL